MPEAPVASAIPRMRSRRPRRRRIALPLLFGFALAAVAKFGVVSPRAYLAVFGGTGLLGRETVYQALQRGEEVAVLARDPAKLLVPLGSGGADADKPIVDSKLTVFQGDVNNLEDVQQVIRPGLDGVVVALGGKTSEVGESMLTDGTSNVIAAMKLVGARRIAVVSSIGVGDSENQAPFFFKVLMRTMMRKIFKDKNNQEALFLTPEGPGSDLDFTIVRPGGLTVDPPTGVVNVIDGKAGSIARADVATFCLGAVLEPEFAYLRKAPCISSVGGTSWVKDRSDKARLGADATDAKQA
eukprot:TRINITY_DN29021_c0_g1_i1.p1 TRINITY_DN29021_c0_g1~~TRINITY_DN29021_c0_g1_i1.p1  ORF type:complete len:323 (-),score=65.37 TRINITY_DN29021_c0_g1_i1:117-1007(-)